MYVLTYISNECFLCIKLRTLQGHKGQGSQTVKLITCYRYTLYVVIAKLQYVFNYFLTSLDYELNDIVPNCQSTTFIGIRTFFVCAFILLNMSNFQFRLMPI